MSRFPRGFLAALLLFSCPAIAQRAATQEEIAAWDIDVRPDGKGLPAGTGTAKRGEAIFQERCAARHGEFGEGVGRWPELAGGQGSLVADRPFKTIGSYWPFVSTIYDYVHRAMPFGNAQSLTADETYSLVAYLLSLNDIVTDENFELNAQTLPRIALPNETGFYDDDREITERAFWTTNPCMTACKPNVRITGRAALLDVTPDAKVSPKME